MANEDPNRGLFFIVLQFLEQQNLTETARSLECETGIYFNKDYFVELLNSCAYSEAESYLCGFTDIHDNLHSTKIYFGIRKLKFFDALEHGEVEKAREVIKNEIEIFEQYNKEIVGQAYEILETKDFMSHELLKVYKNMIEARRVEMVNIKSGIQSNPLLRRKLYFSTPITTLQHMYNHALADSVCVGCNGGPAFCTNDKDYSF